MNIALGRQAGWSATQRFSEALVAYAGGNTELIVEMCAETVAWESCARREDVAFGGCFQGRDEVREFFRLMAPALDGKRIVVKDVIAAGNTIISIIEIVPKEILHPGQCGTRVVSRWTFEAGEIVRFEDYFDVKAAIVSQLPPEEVLAAETDGRFAHYKAEQGAVLSDALEEFFRHNYTRLFELFAKDAVFQSVADPLVGLPAGICGRDAITKRIGGLRETFKLQTFKMMDVIPAGDRAVHIAEIVFNARGAPGERASFRVAGFWDFKDGEITLYKEYFDLPAILNELGRQPGLADT